MESAVECSHENEELWEETRKRRDTGQWEQGKGHDKSQFGIGLVQSVIVVYLHFVATLFHNWDDCKYA